MTNTVFADKADEAHTPIVTVLLNGYLAFEKRRRRRRALALTHTLDDHALKDIGLQRFDISSVAATARADRRR